VLLSQDDKKRTPPKERERIDKQEGLSDMDVKRMKPKGLGKWTPSGAIVNRDIQQGASTVMDKTE